MRLKIYNDKIKRLNVFKYEVERNALLFITHCELIPLTARMQAQFRLNAFPKAASPHYHRQRCLASGSPRAIVKGFRLSRYDFKLMAEEGRLPGVIKAKW